MVSAFDLKKLASLIENFYNLTKIRTVILDENLNELVAFPQKFPSLCQLLRTDPYAFQKCTNCDKHACEMASKNHKPFTYRCHAGLTESIAPLYVENVLVGYLLFGHMLSYPSHDNAWTTISNHCHLYNVDKDKLKKGCYEHPLVSNDYIESAFQIVQALTYYLCHGQIISLQEEKLSTQINNYITSHLTEDLTADILCKQFQIGKTHLYEITKQIYGVGLAEHVRNLRIEKAKHLLESESQLTLDEICDLCGYKNYNHFITVFKRVVGISPKRYARLMHNPKKWALK